MSGISIGTVTSGVSFPDCPNKCKNGMIVNAYQRSKFPCPYCSSKREEIAKGIEKTDDGKTIYELLKIPTYFGGTEFNMTTLLPDFALKFIKQESIEPVERELKKLISSVLIGDLPEYSTMFNLGKKVNEVAFIYPFMIKAYSSGVTVAPLVSAFELCCFRFDLEHNGQRKDKDDYEWGSNYFHYIEADICVVTIDTGVTPDGINAVKGLMQLRANKGKATIIFTNAWSNRILDLCSEENYNKQFLANLYSIQYVDKFVEEESKREEILKQQGNSGNTFINNPNPMKQDTWGREVRGMSNISKEDYKNLTSDNKKIL